VRTSIEIHEHRRIAARGNDPVGDRRLLEFVTSQKLGSFAAFDAVFSIENIGRPAVGIAHGARVRQGFDLLRSLLAIVAVADSAYNWPADCSQLDATA
jgi:hypothetical protein